MYVEEHHIIGKKDDKSTSTHARPHFRVDQERASAQTRVKAKSERRRDAIKYAHGRAKLARFARKSHAGVSALEKL